MDEHSDDTPISYRVVGFDELEGAAAAHYRRQRRRRLLLFVTLPGLVLGTATVATAYGTGLIGTPAVTCEPISQPAPARDSFEVTLLNSNDTDGLGSEIARELTLRDFNIASVGNADSSVYVKGAATIYYGSEGRDNALLLQKQIPGSKTWNDARPGDSVQLILGYGFDKLVSEPDPPLPAPSEIKVNVYNTTWQEGLASQAAGDLKERDFTIGKTGNDPQMSFLEDEVAIIRFGPEGQRSAKRLAQQISGVQLQKDDRTDATVSLVLGNKYKGLKSASSVPDVKPYVRPAETIQKPCTPAKK
ncbi:LytR C-terminal domain-containing protein [Janibacter limosus]|uniref:LytR C-terminal domain-containing protein n=1 Tax=Janibacter limosus TaxID=53458 RepID=UPI000836E573|nr:LytR C-terminal domain-containing protein [Janibacter limosus]